MEDAGPWTAVMVVMSSICHQLPERSFGDETFTVPLCRRCSMFYSAYLAALLAGASLRNGPSLVSKLSVGLMLVTMMAIDVFFMDSTNLSRAATGCLAGAGTGLVAGGLLRSRWREPRNGDRLFAWALVWALVVVGGSWGSLLLASPELHALTATLGVFALGASCIFMAGARSMHRDRHLRGGRIVVALMSIGSCSAGDAAGHADILAPAIAAPRPPDDLQMVPDGTKLDQAKAPDVVREFGAGTTCRALGHCLVVEGTARSTGDVWYLVSKGERTATRVELVLTPDSNQISSVEVVGDAARTSVALVFEDTRVPPEERKKLLRDVRRWFSSNNPARSCTARVCVVASLQGARPSLRIELEPLAGREGMRQCCKYCDKGVPCGDTCMSAGYTCHSMPGCACSGMTKR